MLVVWDTRGLTDRILIITMSLVKQTFYLRPLKPLSDDFDNLKALSLNYFLLGRAKAAVSFISITDRHSDLKKFFSKCLMLCKPDTETMIRQVIVSMEWAFKVEKMNLSESTTGKLEIYKLPSPLGKSCLNDNSQNFWNHLKSGSSEVL